MWETFNTFATHKCVPCCLYYLIKLVHVVKVCCKITEKMKFQGCKRRWIRTAVFSKGFSRGFPSNFLLKIYTINCQVSLVLVGLLKKCGPFYICIYFELLLRMLDIAR